MAIFHSSHSYVQCLLQIWCSFRVYNNCLQRSFRCPSLCSFATLPSLCFFSLFTLVLAGCDWCSGRRESWNPWLHIPLGNGITHLVQQNCFSVWREDAIVYKIRLRDLPWTNHPWVLTQVCIHNFDAIHDPKFRLLLQWLLTNNLTKTFKVI